MKLKDGKKAKLNFRKEQSYGKKSNAIIIGKKHDIRNYYDEKNDHSISGYKPTLFNKIVCAYAGHNYINASLELRTEFNGTKYHTGLFGHDIVRFCRRCHKIDCVHEFEEKEIVWKQDDFFSVHNIIGTCKKCKRRIALRGWSSHHPSDKGHALVEEVLEELHMKPLFDKDGNNNYGSGVYCELITECSRRADSSPDIAKQLAIDYFNGLVDGDVYFA